MIVKAKKKNEMEERAKYLVLDKIYTVYGIYVYQGETLYYLCDDAYLNFPLGRPSEYFEILDSKLSRYWIFGFLEELEKYPIWMFPEWINEPYFQDKITDWEEREVKIFKAYREAMDLEFPNPLISKIAEIGDDEWLICPYCIDAWKSKTTMDGMVRCPKCRNIMHNPRYNEGFRTNGH